METSSVNPAAAGSTAAATPSERPLGAVRKSERPDREAPSQRGGGAADSREALTARPAPASFAASSVLTTYRDVESGRVVVRVSDSERGFVLVEFPPARSLEYLQTLIPGAEETAPQTRIKV